MKNRYELEQEIAILNKEKLHYFNKCQELAERKCETCKYINNQECPIDDYWAEIFRNTSKFSCSLWSKQDD